MGFLFIHDGDPFFFGGGGLSMEWFVNCAKNYIIHGQSIEDMCEHNAEVSQNNDRFQVQ
jgi:hypothetical protein